MLVCLPCKMPGAVHDPGLRPHLPSLASPIPYGSISAQQSLSLNQKTATYGRSRIAVACASPPRPQSSARPVQWSCFESSWIVVRCDNLASLFELVQQILQTAQLFRVMLCQVAINPRSLQ